MSSKQATDGYKKKAHSVYLLTYHIVFVTRYRRPVITDEIGDYMKNHAAYLCGRFDGEMLSAETDRDHMHLLVSMPPDVTPARLVGTLKTQLSKEVRANFREHIQKYLWGDAPFWSSSYFIATTGTTSLERVREYIEGQRTDGHKRKYVKSGRYSKKRRVNLPAIHPQPMFIRKLLEIILSLKAHRMGFSC